MLTLQLKMLQLSLAAVFRSVQKVLHDSGCCPCEICQKVHEGKTVSALPTQAPLWIKAFIIITSDW